MKVSRASVNVCLKMLRHSKCSITFSLFTVKTPILMTEPKRSNKFQDFALNLRTQRTCPFFAHDASYLTLLISSHALAHSSWVKWSLSSAVFLALAVMMKPNCTVQLAGLVSVRPDARDSKEFLLIVSLHVLAQVTNNLTCSAARRSPGVC